MDEISKELIIRTGDGEVNIALLENKGLVEYHNEKLDKGFNVGDIFLGRIKRLVPGLNAAFVDVGYEKDAFLHYHDLGPKAASLQKFISDAITGKRNTAMLDDFEILPDIDKNGKIDDVLKANRYLLVQIAKEPISTKGPRLTCELSIAGRYLVLVPFGDRVSVSQKIKSRDERERLRRLISSIKPKNFGVIVRTVAENKKVAELDADLRSLIDRWKSCFENFKDARPPKKVLGEIDRTNAILRDLLSPSFNQIVTDSKDLYQDICSYLKTIAPESEKIVKLYKGRTDIMEHFGIEKQIKSLFGKHVTMKSGAYLVIEHTEAMHVIDVNSGNTAKTEASQEDSAIKVNIEAAEEVARQLRLRDMGGLIVVDFIDMRKNENRKLLTEKLRKFMSADRAKHQVLPVSRFGLVEITRQRVRPEMEIKTSEVCPTCNGTGEVQASITIIDEIENTLNAIIEEQKVKHVTIAVHPFVAAYLQRGMYTYQRKWFKKYKRWIGIQQKTALALLDYEFLDQDGNEILL
ncbi:MAG: ribonuclease E/G [Salibacteraceae bacterium]